LLAFNICSVDGIIRHKRIQPCGNNLVKSMGTKFELLPVGSDMINVI